MIRCIGLLLCWLMITPSFAKGYQTFEEKGKVGMKDDAGHVVLPPTFEALGWSDGNFSVVGDVVGYRLQGSWGIISLKKEFITRADYESLVYSGGECIVARKKINLVISKTGCINLHGEIKIPFVYDGISVQGLRAIVFNLVGPRYYFGLTDLDNKILIPLVYRNIRPLGTLRFAVENLKNKIALFEDTGNPVTDFSIDSVSLFYRGYARVYQDQLQGLIDRNGMVKLEVKYNSINIDTEGKVWTQRPSDWFFINDKNETIKQLAADEVKPFDERYFAVRMGKVSGVVNGELKTIIPIEYENLTGVEPGKYLAKRNSKAGVISEKGEVIVPFSFDSLIKEPHHYRALNKGVGWQLLTEDGKKLTEKYYEQLLSPNQLGFPAVSKGFSGIVNVEGREFIHCVFDSISSPVNDLLSVKFKGKYGIINTHEDWLVAPQAYPLCVINEQRYLQKQPENNFIKSYDGEILYFTPYPIKFNEENFIESLPDGTVKIISYSGELINRTAMPLDVQEIYPEREGLRGIKKDDRYGFIDDRGRLRIANRYDSIGEFHEGIAAVKLIGKWGFINTNDQIAINPNYDNRSDFLHGLAIVSRNKKFGLIGKDGNIVLSLRYDVIRRLPNDNFLLISSFLQGLADKNGNVLVEPRFSLLEEAGGDLLIACRDGKWGVITDRGLSVVPMIYDRLRYLNSRKVFLAEKKSDWKQVETK